MDGNRLLQLLPENDRAALNRSFRSINLMQGTVLAEPGAKADRSASGSSGRSCCARAISRCRYPADRGLQCEAFGRSTDGKMDHAHAGSCR